MVCLRDKAKGVGRMSRDAVADAYINGASYSHNAYSALICPVL